MPFDSPLPSIPPQPATLASKMRAIFGPNGERWCKGALRRGDQYCLLGAAAAAAYEIGQSDFIEYIHFLGKRMQAAVPRLYGLMWPTVFNDHPDTHWPDILAFLDRLETMERTEQLHLELSSRVIVPAA